MGKLERTLASLRRFWQHHRRMPSYRELAVLAGYRSTNAATKLARRLEAAGFVRRDATGKLVPLQLWGQTRVLGAVEAGFPSPAEEELADTMSLDEWLIGNKEATFMLKVQGDSMTGAGIMPGDMVLVERGRTPRDGDVVIAEVDGQWTMKTLRHRSRGAVLVAANPKYPPIRPKETLNITAVVIAVVRRYRA